MLQIQHFFDPQTYTLTYIVWDQHSRDAVIIDPLLDFDPLRVSTHTKHVDELIAYINRHELTVHYVLETHAHADHLSGAQLLKQRLGAPVVIGEKITEVQAIFKRLFNLNELEPNGAQFDRLVRDQEHLTAGSLNVKVIATPGHTPACVSYLIEDALFTGDALFTEDYGTGRCDFPGGNAASLYSSVHGKLFQLPDATRVFVGHDYQPEGRPLRWETTIADSKQKNPQLNAQTTEEAFVALRQRRDASLDPPKLLYQSVQVNIAGGKLPDEASNGLRYLVLPLNTRSPTDDTGAPLHPQKTET